MQKKESEVDFVKWFSELSNKDIKIAGGKGASLSEMYMNKFPIPPGFVITAQAYSYFIEKSGIAPKIEELLKGVEMEDTAALQKASAQIREVIEKAEMPKEMAEAIVEAYEVLDVNKDVMHAARSKALDILRNSHEPPFVAVRSSATTEDLADASFAGQQESFLNVKGNKDLLEKVKKCSASLFTARAIYYRMKKGFGAMGAQLAVVVQRMVDSDKSGVMFSRNPVSDKPVVLIEAVWGLGEGIVSGMIKPDHFVVDRETTDILETKLAEKKIAIVRSSDGATTQVKLTPERSKQQVMTTHELKRLAQYAMQLEEHYGKPQDIEFAIAGGEIYIVQSRPITTVFAKATAGAQTGKEILVGLGASPGVASGPVKVIHSLEELSKVKKGDVLVTEMTNPDMVVDMQKACAIVTDEGGVTSHAAIVSREMGIPAVVGTEKATTTLKDGDVITVDGNVGKVYAGTGETKLVEIKPIVPTKTKIKVIVDLPDYADRAALCGAQGVGLTRLEGIIAEGGKHPHYYVVKKKMPEYTASLLKGLTRIIKPFKEIWVRSSDIRSDEYRHLEGAVAAVEGNPMLGDHGIRFSIKHPDILSAELEAAKQLALAHKDKIVGFMMPQVISAEEFEFTKAIADKIGMPNNFKIGIMVETPAAVHVIEDLCKAGIKFVSFGTNDLTQFTLAIDRNNPEVQHLFNEMHPAVLASISKVIRCCKRYNVETSICGQAGSRPDMVKFLIDEGINSVSVNADAAFKVSEVIAAEEAQRANRPDEAEEVPEPTFVPVEENSESDSKESGKEEKVILLRENVSYGENATEDAILKEIEGEEEYNPGPSQSSEAPSFGEPENDFGA